MPDPYGTCAVCFNAVGENTAATLTCGHVLDSKCLADSLRLQPECPVCRVPHVGPIIKLFFDRQEPPPVAENSEAMIGATHAAHAGLQKAIAMNSSLRQELADTTENLRQTLEALSSEQTASAELRKMIGAYQAKAASAKPRQDNVPAISLYDRNQSTPRAGPNGQIFGPPASAPNPLKRGRGLLLDSDDEDGPRTSVYVPYKRRFFGRPELQSADTSRIEPGPSSSSKPKHAQPAPDEPTNGLAPRSRTISEPTAPGPSRGPRISTRHLHNEPRGRHEPIDSDEDLPLFHSPMMQPFQVDFASWETGDDPFVPRNHPNFARARSRRSVPASRAARVPLGSSTEALGSGTGPATRTSSKGKEPETQGTLNPPGGSSDSNRASSSRKAGESSSAHPAPHTTTHRSNRHQHGRPSPASGLLIDFPESLPAPRRRGKAHNKRGNTAPDGSGEDNDHSRAGPSR